MPEQVNLRWKYPGMRKAARLLGIRDTDIYQAGIIQQLEIVQDNGKISIRLLDAAIDDIRANIAAMSELLEDLTDARAMALEEMGQILAEPETSPEHSIRKILDELVKPLFPGRELYRTCHRMHETDPDEAFKGFIQEITDRSQGKIHPGMFPQDILWNWAVDQGVA